MHLYIFLFNIVSQRSPLGQNGIDVHRRPTHQTPANHSVLSHVQYCQMNPKLCPGLAFACPGMSDDCSPIPCPSGFSGRVSASCQLAGQSQFIPSLSVDKPLRVYVLVWPDIEYLTEPSGSVGVEITPDSLVKTEEFVTFFGLRFRRLIVQFTIRNCFFAFFCSLSLSFFPFFMSFLLLIRFPPLRAISSFLFFNSHLPSTIYRCDLRLDADDDPKFYSAAFTPICDRARHHP